MNPHIEKLLRFSEQVPPMQEAFKSAGFLLPSMELANIESVRIRGTEERSYEYFLLERMKERMGLYGSEQNDRDKSCYRSDYVSWVIDTLDADGFHLGCPFCFDTDFR